MFYLQAASSFVIVGLGQIIKGETNKGLLMLLTFYFVLPAILYLALLFNSQQIVYILSGVIISAIILWLYSIGDALLHQ